MLLSRFFHWLVWRYFREHRLLGILSILSVATGVAVFLAIQLANVSARRSFAASIDLIAGKSQLEVSAPSDDLSDAVFPSVQKSPGIAAATPMVRGLVSLSDFPGEYLDLLGVDVFTNPPFQTGEFTKENGGDFDLHQWLGRGDAIAVSERFAARHHLSRGSQLRVMVNGAERIVTIAFLLGGQVIENAGDHFALLDLGWAQELLGHRGRLSSIQLQLLPKANRAAVIASLRRLLPANAVIASPARRSEQVDQMLGSFQLNLTAMSLVSLLVGAFLIFNAVAASVVRRRREIGILRALGTSTRQIRLVFLGEAMIAGVTGSLLGLVFGTFLARALLATVSGTISTLYTLIDVRQLAPNAFSYLVAGALGCVTALAAAWIPARNASSLPPVVALNPEIVSEKREPIPRRFLSYAFLAALLSAIASVFALRTGPAWLSFLAAFFVLLGAACLAPLAISLVARATTQFFPGLIARLAAQQFRRSLSRNAITVAALSAAVAMATAVGVMIFSFRQTVTDWIRQTLIADIFVTPSTNEIAGPTSFLAPEVQRFFAQHPDVLAVDTYRQIDLPFRGGIVGFAGIRASGPRSFPFVAGDEAALMHRFREERCVIVSESLARRYHLVPGQTFAVPTVGGSVELPIAAVFYDYTRDQGLVFTNASNFRDLLKDDRVNSLGIYLKPRASGDRVVEEFRREFSRRGEFAIYSNVALRRRAFEIFDQTFAITHVLRAIAVIVAVIGIFFSLTTLISERTRLFGIMRSIGLSIGQLRRVILLEAVLIAASASLLGLLGGSALAEILTAVVNRAFFGWTIRLGWPWPMFILTPCWLAGAALIAALFPAWGISQKSLPESIRAE